MSPDESLYVVYHPHVTPASPDQTSDSSSHSESTPRASLLESPHALEPAHIITSSRAGSTPSRGLSGTPGPSSRSSTGVLSSPININERTKLLPAFGDEIAERSHALHGSPPRGSVSKPGPSRVIRAEDVVDDVFRINKFNQSSRPNSATDFTRKRRHPPLGNVGLTPTPSSEPRPERKSFDFDRDVATERRQRGTPDPRPANNPDRIAPGISVSPVKGRRIQLVRPASPGSAAGSAPSSPRGSAATPASISNITFQWLQSSPTNPRHVRAAETEQELAERETRKRKRLEAFLDNAGSSSGAKHKHKSPLKPVEVKGMGRLALHPDDLLVEYITPSKRTTRKRGSRKAAAAAATPKKKITAFGLEVREDPLKTGRPPPLDDEETKSDTEDSVEPDWLDHVYPWSESKRRAKEPSGAEKLRLKQLEQFFDRLTDDEDSADDFDTVVTGTPTSEVAPPLRPSLSGGKLGSVPQLSTPSLGRSISGASDSGDARTVLFARHGARPAAPRPDPSKAEGLTTETTNAHAANEDAQDPENQAAVGDSVETESQEDDDGAITCVCGKTHTDTPMVRCDSCHTWSHLDCLGINDESQLGAEWFCFNCEQRSMAEQGIGDDTREPTFTLTAETPRPRLIGAVKFYDPPPLTNSPLFPANTSDIRSAAKVPVTPTAGTVSHSRLRTPGWDPSGGSHITPRTPLIQRPFDIRALSTPKLFTERGAPAEAFDPTSTPSRGIQLGTPFQDSTSSDRAWTYGRPPITPIHRILPDRSMVYKSAGGGSARQSKPMTFYPQDGSPFLPTQLSTRREPWSLASHSSANGKEKSPGPSTSAHEEQALRSSSSD